MPCPFQWLVITDGTTDSSGIRNQVDLLSLSGFCLLEEGDWRPGISEPKGGGVWKDSPLADGRRPADFKASNVVESMTLTLTALDQDQLIRDTQELRRLLTKARTYGTTDWQSEPVWIEAQSPGESNMRYAILWNWGTPNDGNPYEEPFWQTVAQAGMDDFILVLEREPYWRSDEPRTSTCVVTAGYDTYCWPCYVEFDGFTTIIAIPDNAQIRDLHDAAMTAEGWVRIDGWGENNLGCVINKGWASAAGWRFNLDNTQGLVANIKCATADGRAWTGNTIVTPDSTWHHVAFTWDDATYTNPRIWVDGVEQTNNTQNRNGVITTDNGLGAAIGNRAGADRTFDGEIGWTRLSDNIRYAAPFTPPVRCNLPDIDGNTMGQWIGAECSGATIDNQEGLAAIDGTLTAGSFDCDCNHTYGNVDDSEDVVPTCNDEVYIANKDNKANLTNIHTYTAIGAVWGANLLNAALPYNLFPAVPANNDAVYFGINTAILDSGPFCSLVFDLQTAASYPGAAAGAWQYWNGGWVALATQDNTDHGGAASGPLSLTGVGSVHWIQPSDWVANDPGVGITGYWVRILLNPGAGIVVPVQQNRQPYTITWSFYEVEDTAVGGDVPALLSSIMHNQSGGGTVARQTSRLILGLRSISRGSDFLAHVNLSDEQNHSGITVTPFAPDVTMVTDPQAPSGRRLNYAPGVNRLLTTQTTVTFDSTIELDYRGRFRFLMRVQQIAGAAGDISARLEYGFLNIYQYTNELYTQVVGDWETLDFGSYILPPTPVDDDESISTVYVNIQLSNSNGAVASLRLLDFVFIPTDEWSLDTASLPSATGAYPLVLDNEGGLRVDSVLMPRRTIRCQAMVVASEEIRGNFQAITSGPSILQTNETQRMWIHHEYSHQIGAAPPRSPDPEISSSVQATTTQRYYSMRGDR